MISLQLDSRSQRSVGPISEAWPVSSSREVTATATRNATTSRAHTRKKSRAHLQQSFNRWIWPFKGKRRRAEESPVSFEMGVSPPSASGVIVNTPGHSDSAMTAVLRVKNAGDADVTVSCTFFATAHSYDGNTAQCRRGEASAVGAGHMFTIVVPAKSTSSECKYSISRKTTLSSGINFSR